MHDRHLCIGTVTGVFVGLIAGLAVRSGRIQAEQAERTGRPMRVPSERVRTLAAQVRAEADNRAKVATPAWILELAERDPMWRRRSDGRRRRAREIP